MSRSCSPFASRSIARHLARGAIGFASLAGSALLADLAAREIPLSQAHTSGHASIPDLQRLAAAVAPTVLVPIHTFEASRFPELFGPSVALKEDGVWWKAR